MRILVIKGYFGANGGKGGRSAEVSQKPPDTAKNSARTLNKHLEK